MSRVRDQRLRETLKNFPSTSLLAPVQATDDHLKRIGGSVRRFAFRHVARLAQKLVQKLLNDRIEETFFWRTAEYYELLIVSEPRFVRQYGEELPVR